MEFRERLILGWYIMPPFSVKKSTTSKKPTKTELATCFCWFLAWLTLLPENGGIMFPQKVWSFYIIHGNKTQMTMIFTVIAVRTSNPTPTCV
jgi:hypothetical protein